MKKTNKGFTIVELVIVIAVIAILAAVLIPTFSGVVQKANESASLQTATSAMKTVLAQSESATIADGTLFCVGDKTNGIQYIYKYENNKMGTANLGAEEEYTNLLGKEAKVGATTPKLNTIIVPVKGEQASTEAATLKVINDMFSLFDEDGNNTLDRYTQVSATKAAADAALNAQKAANYASKSDEEKAQDTAKINLWTAVSNAIPANAKYYINVGTEASPTYIGVLTNVDFAEGTVVFTYSK